jgi:hypothetical protein
MRVPEGGNRLLPGEGSRDEADEKAAEAAGQDAKCAANSKCAVEKEQVEVVRAVCENLAERDAVQREIPVVVALGTPGLTVQVGVHA